jgi:hypothetical protein
MSELEFDWHASAVTMPRLSMPAPVSSVEKAVASPFRVPSISTVPRRARSSFFLIILIAIALLYLHSIDISSGSVSDDLLPFLQDLPPSEGGSSPPRFYEWHEREKRLPQHNPDLSFPQGREGRYIRFSNQVYGACSRLLTSASSNMSLPLFLAGLGWGNAMQEMIFNAHLAYLSNRMYVL